MKSAKPTMSDVAKRAGVSPATVARVIYSNGYVTTEKREIIEAAVREIGYRPNVMARGLRTARSFTLGLVVGESRLNAFHPYIAHQVQLEALKHGYTVLTLNNNDDARAERQGVQRFLDQHVDAIIFCAAIDPSNVRLAANARVPIVQIEREIASVGNMVMVDARVGMIEAVTHLHQLGHSRIAFIGGRLDFRPMEKSESESVEFRRLQFFKEAMESFGLAVPEEYILTGPYYAENSERQTGYKLMRSLLAESPTPTAVIAGADLLAAGALQAIAEADLKVPRDISIIGYDDTMAEILTPPLTSIAQPIKELGRNAVELAVSAIEKETFPDTTRTYPTNLVVRSSTAEPRP
jgi:LacI family transcriptional regulator